MNFWKNIIFSTYSFRMRISRFTGLGIKVYENKNHIQAPENFYSLKAIKNDDQEVYFEKFRGKKVLIVNLASQCGFTPQYQELEKLYQQNKGMVILGFPSNNFGAQEPGSDEEIARFCKLNFGVTFPIFKKDDVKGNRKQPVYQWLTDKSKNGWNDKEPQWNFYKYLVDESGNLSGIYSSSILPST